MDRERSTLDRCLSAFAWGAAISVGGILLACAIAGCAVGKAGDGTPVVGVSVGPPDPEDTKQALAAGGGLIGGLIGGPAGAAAGQGIGMLIAGGLGLLGIGGAAYGAKKAGDAKAEKASKEAADKAWDESHARTAALYTPAPGQS